MRTYRTTSRRLEEFLFAHFIKFKEQYRNLSGDTVWVYEDTRKLRDTIWEYGELLKQNGLIDDGSSA